MCVFLCECVFVYITTLAVNGGCCGLTTAGYQIPLMMTRNEKQDENENENGTRTKAILICIPDACCNASAAWNANESSHLPHSLMMKVGVPRTPAEARLPAPHLPVELISDADEHVTQ
uniref:HDC08824 n=1 Tax=Drosophila melanogaster TaxID=7227 RepID=Q6ILN9_DROME|nr:TPA_inf: HDC08824 [Drosophila melanogaster]